VVAVPSWQKRNYDKTSPTGCSSGGRTCVLKNPLDYTMGTTNVYSGPSLTTTIQTLSGNPLSCASGIYKEDFFYNSS
jgi:hypothetical protein